MRLAATSGSSLCEQRNSLDPQTCIHDVLNELRTFANRGMHSLRILREFAFRACGHAVELSMGDR
jgi:hypothetical protein